ncbi:glutamate N-acetyltransferase [Geothermobacter ehrlichii]|uniref:Arginine biosynthesis bifunctional protein ArgJ n=1 Tax=Geothermobacter ehrlichii TaxID=213224 RepID=A0A5D3WHA8_9BACT|nr:bifunctional glutamate N-acetyltransferase/amino-acid acetyltransferase ArgJ [Geothermobacter ehrlichii]TYO98239.1 glutamate N-acetyltransferase [Geothermobacter ehrlichii]
MNAESRSVVRGYRFASGAAGIKASGKADLGLIVSETPAAAAGVFTRNQVAAAPVVVTSGRLAKGRCQAIVVNSGNANACTGERGMRDAVRMGELVARALGIDQELVAVSSTGVIGQPMPMAGLEDAVARLAGRLDPDGWPGVAEAIMTTDSFAKTASRTGAGYGILGIAKGAGMIHPDMATMLAFVLTDAAVDPALMKTLLLQAVDRTFNAITVDGDTSTNDMVLLLANGRSGGDVIAAGSREAEQFAALLEEVLLELAKMIVRDGEGATKLVEVRVTGAVSDAEARLAARSIATSSLVKTAFFGEDANWGRIIAAAGYSGATVDPDRVRILFDDVEMARNGLAVGGDSEARGTEVLRRDAFVVTVDLGLGDGAFSYYTSDLTHDYIRINAEYRT